MKAIIGLDIGGTKVLGALYNEAGELLERGKKKTKANEGIDTVMGQVYKVIDDLLAFPEVEVTGIGVGVPGLVNQKGVVTFSPNIPFKDFDLADRIQKKYHLPVVVGNDVNVAMYGEFRHTESSYKNVLGLFIGTGIGGAIIIDEKLYIGQGSAAEFGHMVVNADGAYCGCGAQGCLEAHASKTAIQKAITTQLHKGRKSMLADLLKEDGAVIKSSSLKKAFDESDPLAVEVMLKAARFLGIAVGTLINQFHPEAIIFGGGVIEAMGESFVDLVAREASQHAMPGLMETVDLKCATLGDDAGIFGAYQLAKATI